MTSRSAPAAAASVVLFALLWAPCSFAQVASYQIVGDGIPKSLTGAPGNAARGRALLAERSKATCLKCHSIRQKELSGGDKGPALDGVGAALTPAQLRLSVVDLSQVTRGTEMPTFHKRGDPEPKLTAQEVEDIVAFLATLRR